MKNISEFKSQAAYEKIKLATITGEIWSLSDFKIIKIGQDLESYWVPNNNLPVTAEKFLSFVVWSINN